MRVIAGTARRLKLKTIEGLETRPTTDRIKETLFNIINPELYNCVFLDLFSGSGGIGIEALSRGAKKAIFVEKNRKAVECIKDNLQFTHLEEKGEVIAADVLSAITRLDNNEHIDIIYMDAPYKLGIEESVLKALNEVKSVDSDTMIIIEAALKTYFEYLYEIGYNLERIKEYKTNKHLFIRKFSKWRI